MELVYNLFFSGVISILLVKYYNSFLILKSERRILALFSFGILYFVLRYTVEYCFSEIMQEPAFYFIKIIIMAGIIYVPAFIYFKKDRKKQIFLLCSFLAVQDICTLISLSSGSLFVESGRMLFDFLLMNNTLMTIEQTINYFNTIQSIVLVMHILIFMTFGEIALKSIKKNFIYKNYPLRSLEMFSLIVPCLTGLSVTYVLRVVILQINSDGVLFSYSPFTNILICATAVFILLTLLVSVKQFQKTIQFHNEEKNRTVLQVQIQQLQEHMQTVSNNHAEIRGIRHDMKNHFANIRLLAKAAREGDFDAANELETYLDKFGNTLEQLDFVYQTGNSVADVIINQKYQEAAGWGIHFTANFIYPSHLDFDSYDLAVIISNALDNAIEACKNMTGTERFIQINAYTKKKMFFIEIENSFAGQVVFDDFIGLPLSNKGDPGMHGIGLSNILRCAKKYFGDIDVQISEESEKNDHNIFKLTIMLQGQTQK